MPLPLTHGRAALIILDILSDRGPQTTMGLASLMAGHPECAGLDTRALLEDELDNLLFNGVVELPDERVAYLPPLVGGRVVTHRVTAQEIAESYVELFPDLAPLAQVFTLGVDFEDGSSAVPTFDEDDAVDQGLFQEGLPDGGALAIPPGIFAKLNLKPGALVAIKVVRGVVRVTKAPRTAKAWPEEVVAALRDCGHRRGTTGMPIEAAIWELCDRFTGFLGVPGEPLTDLIERSDGMIDGEYLVPAGTDLAARARQRVALRMVSMHGVTRAAADRAALLGARFYEVKLAALLALRAEDDGPDEDVAEDADDGAGLGPVPVPVDVPGPLDGAGLLDRLDLAALVDRTTQEYADALLGLAEPAMATALVGSLMAEAEPFDALALGIFADSLIDDVETLGLNGPTADPRLGHAKAAMNWMTARAMERMGDTLAAESVLVETHLAAPSWAPVLEDLAYYASDRGELARALMFAKQAGLPSDDPLMRVLQRMAAVPVRALSKNQPCWCGSGRKYKLCHEGNEQLPLSARGYWLYNKAAAYVDRGAGRHAVLELAVSRAQAVPSGMMAALGALLVSDLALMECGQFARFVEERGCLLPDDELLLAQQWLLNERSLWEVTEVRPTRGLTLRDLRTGDVRDVDEKTASRTLKVNDLVACRVMPAGDSWQIFGGAEPVPMRFRDQTLTALDTREAFAILDALNLPYLRPKLANRDSDAFVFHETLVRIRSVATATKKLDQAFERSGESEWLLLDGPKRATSRSIIASFTLDGNEILVETNSAARNREALAHLREIFPTLVVLSTDQAAADDLIMGYEKEPPARGSARPMSHDDPAVIAAVSQMIAKYEAEWVDESVPALGGLTPRQALTDPTRREDLIRLLDSFPATDSPMEMSAQRLRVTLGLA